MGRKSALRFDRIGYWSEIKLQIIKEYATAYSTIFSAERQRDLIHVYIDAFAGAGIHISKRTKESVLGSPLNALLVNPPFREYHFIDLDRAKVATLKKIVGERSNVHIHDGDCNNILLKEVFPGVRFKDYRRGLCLLDPYGLHLKWEVVETAGRMKSIDMFLNFPVADMNRNVLWRHPVGVDPTDVERMNLFWGDESWRQIAYATDRDLFGHPEKEDNETVAEAFRQRLQEVAGFEYVPGPLPMRNSRRAIVYYLFFASQKAAGKHIVEDIFQKFRRRGT
jgi:three-Cys-motif partner protein